MGTAGMGTCAGSEPEAARRQNPLVLFQEGCQPSRAGGVSLCCLQTTVAFDVMTSSGLPLVHTPWFDHHSSCKRRKPRHHSRPHTHRFSPPQSHLVVMQQQAIQREHGLVSVLAVLHACGGGGRGVSGQQRRAVETMRRLGACAVVRSLCGGWAGRACNMQSWVLQGAAGGACNM
eukprot:366553-Chlamydomonas_euryale.AAC.20